MFSKKRFIFQKIEVSNPKIKKISYIFSKKIFYFGRWNPLKKLLIAAFHIQGPED